MSSSTAQNSSIDINSATSNMVDFYDKKYKELDLSISVDLNLFLDNVRTDYNEVVKYRRYADSEQYKSLDIEDIVGEDVFKTFVEKFHSLEQKINICKDLQIIDLEIPDTLVEEMQVSYNDLACLKKYVLEVYENITFSTQEDFDTRKILEKADKIIDDLSSVSETPHGILHKATDLYEDIKDAELNFPKDTSKLQEAYWKLEDFARTAEIGRLAVDVPKSGEHRVPIIHDRSADISDEIITTPTLRRKKMQIISDNAEGNILITVAKQTEEIIDNRESRKINNALVKKNLNDSENFALANIETKDPINAIIKDVSNKQSNWQLPQRQSLVSEFISDEKHLELIKTHYGSIESFDKILSITVNKIEDSTKDAFERWLGESHSSPFLYLKNMKLSEVDKLTNSLNSRVTITAKDIKYETFLTWTDLMHQMLELVGNSGDIKFGKLFVLWMIECNLVTD